MKLNLDFSTVSDDKATVPQGKYVAKVESITQEDGKSGYAYLKWELKIVKGTAKGLHVNHITSLKPSAMFNLRNTLTACGVNVPKSAVSLDTRKLIGKTLGIEVEDREYEGNVYPNVKKTFPADEYSADVAMASTVEDDDEIPFSSEDELELSID